MENFSKATIKPKIKAFLRKFPMMWVLMSKLRRDAISTAVSPELKEAQNCFDLGKNLQEKGKFEEAIRSYEKALELNPDWAQPYLDIANILTQIKNFPAALDNYDKAIALKFDWAEAYFYRGNALKWRRCSQSLRVPGWKCVHPRSDLGNPR